jgi:hypothetical protein
VLVVGRVKEVRTRHLEPATSYIGRSIALGGFDRNEQRSTLRPTSPLAVWQHLDRQLQSVVPLHGAHLLLLMLMMSMDIKPILHTARRQCLLQLDYRLWQVRTCNLNFTKLVDSGGASHALEQCQSLTDTPDAALFFVA